MNKVTKFQTATDLTDMAKMCGVLSWNVSHSRELDGGGTYVHGIIDKKNHDKVAEILKRQGIEVTWQEAVGFSSGEEFVLPQEMAEKNAFLKQLKNVKTGMNKFSSQTLVEQIANIFGIGGHGM